jgi:acetyl/propionyl-CoA carboxylase alpha subunit
MAVRYIVHTENRIHEVAVTPAGEGYVLEIDGTPVTVDSRLLRGGSLRSLIVDGRSYESATMPVRDGMDVYVSGDVFRFRVTDLLWARAEGSVLAAARGREDVLSPMPGAVVRILVAVGESVDPGQTVAVVEAMKMQNDVAAVRGGQVTEIRAEAGAVVDQGAVLVVLDDGGEAGRG